MCVVDDQMAPLVSVCLNACNRTVRPSCVLVAQDMFILPPSLRHRGKPRNNTACVITAVPGMYQHDYLSVRVRSC